MQSFSHQLSNAEYYSIGAITAFAEVIVTNPLWVIKTNLQQEQPIPRTLKGLYRGGLTNILGFVPLTGLQVAITPWIEHRIFGSLTPQQQKINAALFSGILSSFACCPIELIMTQQNNHPGLTLINAIKKQIAWHGIKGLFIGQSATLIREAGFSVCFLALTPLVKNELKQHINDDNIAAIAAGTCTGLTLTPISQPIDTIKTMQQANAHQMHGFFRTAKDIGFSKLFSGTLLRGGTLITSLTVMSWLREQMERYYEMQHQPNEQNNRDTTKYTK